MAVAKPHTCAKCHRTFRAVARTTAELPGPEALCLSCEQAQHVPTVDEMREQGGDQVIPDWVGHEGGLVMAHPSVFEADGGPGIRRWLQAIPHLHVETSRFLTPGQLFWVRMGNRPPGLLPSKS